MRKGKLPDVGVLPKSGGETVEKTGINDTGYLDKKGINGQDSVVLPPGMNIEAQKMSDIHEMPMKKLTSLSYPGDGWD